MGFSKAIVDIRMKQQEIERHISSFEASLVAGLTPQAQTEGIETMAIDVRQRWWDMFWSLVGKYNDGYIVAHDALNGKFTSTAVGYPSWWLEAVHFERSLASTPAASFDNL